MTVRIDPRKPAAAAPHLALAALYLALALAAGWPLWADPAARIQNLADPLLNAYILDWAHHALFHQLGAFFDATQFWPHELSLAYGEHLITPALLALPLRLFTQSAVALHNLSVVQAYLLCALAAHALAWHYFRSVGAAGVAGLAYGFAAYRLSQSGHIQLIHGEFLPLMALAFEKLLEGGGRRWRWALFGAALGQWLASWYWAVFSFWCLTPYIAARLGQFLCEPRGRDKDRDADRGGKSIKITITSEDKITSKGMMGREAGMILLPLLLAAICALPVALPYFKLKRAGHFFRPPEASEGLAARPGDFLSPTPRNLVYGRLALGGAPRSDPGESERRLFPGLVLAASALAGAGFALRSRRGLPARFPGRLWVAIAATTLLFSFGSRWGGASGEGGIPLPYAAVERFFPLAGVMRVPARWALPGLLPFAMLAAAGWTALASAFAARSRLVWGLAIALLTIESLPAPAPFASVPRAASESDLWLANQPPGSPVLELPLRPLDDNRHLLAATRHHQPMINGSNGFLPPGHMKLMRELATFPSPEAMAKLHELNARFVRIDPRCDNPVSAAWSEAGALALLNHPPALTKILRVGGDIIVDLGPPDAAKSRP